MPGCIQFGSTDLVKLFSDFGDYAEFKLVPAVRHPEGSCVDESGCKWEAASACVFAHQENQADRVAFLACMDESKSKDPDAAAAACAPKIGEDTIKKCAHGSEGKKLLAAASADFNQATFCAAPCAALVLPPVLPLVSPDTCSPAGTEHRVGTGAPRIDDNPSHVHRRFGRESGTNPAVPMPAGSGLRFSVFVRR